MLVRLFLEQQNASLQRLSPSSIYKGKRIGKNTPPHSDAPLDSKIFGFRREPLLPLVLRLLRSSGAFSSILCTSTCSLDDDVRDSDLFI